MDRKIKGRSWDGERMIYWDTLQIDFMGKTPIIRFKNDTLDGKVKLAKHVDMLCIGTEDKYGTEIYEDDIVKFNANYTLKETGWQKGVIAKDNFRYVFYVNEEKYDMWEETDEGPYAWEVLGNIYENPEIIEQ